MDPDEEVIFVLDGAPPYNNPLFPGPHTELQKLPAYSPFLNIVEQAISFFRAAMKADIAKPEIQLLMGNRAAARTQCLPLGEFRTCLLF